MSPEKSPRATATGCATSAAKQRLPWPPPAGWPTSKLIAPYVAILDADDVWMSQKLERQVELFHSDQRLGLVYCDAIYFTDRGDSYRLFKLAPPHRGRLSGNCCTGTSSSRRR